MTKTLPPPSLLPTLKPLRAGSSQHRWKKWTENTAQKEKERWRELRRKQKRERERERSLQKWTVLITQHTRKKKPRCIKTSQQMRTNFPSWAFPKLFKGLTIYSLEWLLRPAFNNWFIGRNLVQGHSGALSDLTFRPSWPVSPTGPKIPDSPWNRKRQREKASMSGSRKAITNLRGACQACKKRGHTIPSLLWVLAQVRCRGLLFSPDEKGNTEERTLCWWKSTKRTSVSESTKNRIN